VEIIIPVSVFIVATMVYIFLLAMGFIDRKPLQILVFGIMLILFGGVCILAFAEGRIIGFLIALFGLLNGIVGFAKKET